MALGQLFERDDANSIDRTVQKWNTVTQSLCIAAMTLFFLLRVYTRVFLLNGFNKEDCKKHPCQDSDLHANSAQGPV